jgi:hypothetical protein
MLHYWGKQRAYWGKCPSRYIVKKCPEALPLCENSGNKVVFDM